MAQGVNQPLYTVDILRLAAAIPHLGPLTDPQGGPRPALPPAAARLRWTSQSTRTAASPGLASRCEACAFGQASAALMGAHALGRQAGEVEDALAAFADWLDGARDDPGPWPGLETLGPARPRRARHGAMLLPFRALLGAIEDALERQRI